MIQDCTVSITRGREHYLNPLFNNIAMARMSPNATMEVRSASDRGAAVESFATLSKVEKSSNQKLNHASASRTDAPSIQKCVEIDMGNDNLSTGESRLPGEGTKILSSSKSPKSTTVDPNLNSLAAVASLLLENPDLSRKRSHPGEPSPTSTPSSVSSENSQKIMSSSTDGNAVLSTNVVKRRKVTPPHDGQRLSSLNGNFVAPMNRCRTSSSSPSNSKQKSKQVTINSMQIERKENQQAVRSRKPNSGTGLSKLSSRPAGKSDKVNPVFVYTFGSKFC